MIIIVKKWVLSENSEYLKKAPLFLRKEFIEALKPAFCCYQDVFTDCDSIK